MEHSSSRSKLESLEKDELIQIILENGYEPVTNSLVGDVGGKKRKKGKKARKQRPIDMSKYARRFVALQLSYLGWNYHGFASQQNIDTTVEGVVFKALRETRLISECDSNEDLCYSRCGRTDKGVSAMRNVLCLRLRSNQRPATGSDGAEYVIYSGTEVAGGCRPEMDYADIINRRLPPEIRVLNWVTAPRGFSARFNCCERTYRYFFCRSTLCIEAMQDAGRRLVGEHNFTNFAKMDALQVHGYVRTVLAFSIHAVEEVESADQLLYFEITGSAFLWHMVRNIAYVLFLVGLGLETPDVVDFMLDMETCPRKPLYPPAEGLPLVLYDCKFTNVSFDGPETLPPVVGRFDNANKGFGQRLLESINGLWWERRIQLGLTQSVRQHVYDQQLKGARQLHDVWATQVPIVLHRRHTPLCDRKTEESYDEKVAAMSISKRRKRNETLRGEKKRRDLEEIEDM